MFMSGGGVWSTYQPTAVQQLQSAAAQGEGLMQQSSSDFFFFPFLFRFSLKPPGCLRLPSSGCSLVVFSALQLFHEEK